MALVDDEPRERRDVLDHLTLDEERSARRGQYNVECAEIGHGLLLPAAVVDAHAQARRPLLDLVLPRGGGSQQQRSTTSSCAHVARETRTDVAKRAKYPPIGHDVTAAAQEKERDGAQYDVNDRFLHYYSVHLGDYLFFFD